MFGVRACTSVAWARHESRAPDQNLMTHPLIRDLPRYRPIGYRLLQRSLTAPRCFGSRSIYGPTFGSRLTLLSLST